MKRILKKINDIVLSIETVVLIAIVILNVFPWFINMEHYVVLSGSMEPEIHTGAMVYVDKNATVENIKVGDIIAFKTNTVLVTHRVEKKDDKNKVFITKGDANENVDFAPVPYDMYVGKTVFSIPYFGYIMNYVHSIQGMVILVTVVISQGLLSRLLKDDEEDEKTNINIEGENENERK